MTVVKQNCTGLKRIPGNLKVWLWWSAMDGRGVFIANIPFQVGEDRAWAMLMLAQFTFPSAHKVSICWFSTPFLSLTGLFQFCLGQQASFSFRMPSLPITPMYTMALLADDFCIGILKKEKLFRKSVYKIIQSCQIITICNLYSRFWVLQNFSKLDPDRRIWLSIFVTVQCFLNGCAYIPFPFYAQIRKSNDSIL